MSGSLLLVVRA